MQGTCFSATFLPYFLMKPADDEVPIPIRQAYKNAYVICKQDQFNMRSRIQGLKGA